MDGYELAPSLAQLCVMNGWQAGGCLGRRLLEFRLSPNNPVHLLCRAKDRLLERSHLYFLGVNSLVSKEVIRTRELWQAVGV